MAATTISDRREAMLAKVLSTAVLAALLYANSVSASAAGPPKTKAQCEKLTDMQWDAKTKKCVKK
jgi:hypothetical protein